MDRLRLSLAAMRSAGANRNLLLFQAGRLASVTAKWGNTVALAVYAYKASGPAGVAVAAILHLVPGALSAPFAGTLARRFGPGAVRTACGLVRISSVAGAAAVALADGPAAAVYALFVLVSAANSVSRPLQDARLPQLSRTPQHLTSANLALSVMESAGIFLGPIAAAGLLSLARPGWVFAACAGSYAVAKGLNDLIRVQSPRPTAGHGLGILSEIVAGARLVARNPRAWIVVVLFAGFGLVGGGVDGLIKIGRGHG